MVLDRVSDVLVPPAVVIHFPVPTHYALLTVLAEIIIQRLTVACSSANTSIVTFLLG